MEMNQAETAFLLRQEDGFSLRWFTPNKEVDLCGHATLASAHYLWEEQQLATDATARFHTRSGWLAARRDADQWITLDFPAIASRPAAPPAEPRRRTRRRSLARCCGATSTCSASWRMRQRCAQLTPDLAAIAAWDVRGVIVTAPGDRAGIDFVSRCFFPAYGVPEDPVTGSAHCALASYWSGVLGRDDMVGYQASARGGTGSLPRGWAIGWN